MSAPPIELPSASPADLEAKRAPAALALITALANALRREEIGYCHWKSNAHLDESAAGRTDLDVLVDRADAQRLAVVLSRLGFKRFAATPWLAYPAVEDHLALDRETGRLIHLHLHYELILGERHLKGYRLPWEAHVLSSRRLDASTGLFVADPALELLLLLVRSALKLRLRDGLRGGGGLEPGAEREYEWLRTRVASEDLSARTERLLGPEAADAVGRLGVQAPSRSWLRRFRRLAWTELSACRTYTPAGSHVRRIVREACAIAAAADRRWVRSTHPRRRTNPRGGLGIALVGCDGAGKSTLAAALVEWLSWKLDVTPIYLGSGDGPASLVRWPLRVALRAVPRARSPGGPGAGADRRGVPGLARAVWALVLCWEKRGKLARGIRARNRGLVVVYDRYPQARFAGFNDGPLLQHWLGHRRSIARAAARWEATAYRWATRHPPDLVLKLLVSPDVTRTRKPETPEREVYRRIDAVRRLAFEAPSQVLELDADAPFETVLLRAKEAIWEHL